MLIVRIATQPMVKPAGKTAANWSIRILSGPLDAVPETISPVPEMPWPLSLPVGTYKVRGYRQDSTGAPLGNEVESTYNWTGEGAEMIDVAAGVSVVNV